MSDIAIRVENLGKMYRIGALKKQATTTGKRLQNLALSPFDYLRRTLRGPIEEEILWALKDVSFEVKQGEVVGIIGRNGAGKSTLLKILSRITEPTEGRAELYGRVSSLLEVGTGFHPDLTGRENVYLNGTILGMTKAEIDSKFDEIVAFSGVEKFIDTPVKRYSSGMRVRLAFSVAAHLEPEILLIDEVLAVGDAAFQRKCLGKMGEVAQGGRTVLFVSHQMGSISKLCEKVFWIDEGRLNMVGPAEKIISRYLTKETSEDGQRVWENGISEVDEFKVKAVRIRNHLGEITGKLGMEEFWLEIEYEVLQSLPFARIGASITTVNGTIVLTTYDADQAEYTTNREPGVFTNKCQFPGNLLAPGRYNISVNCGMPNVKNLVKLENTLTFDIEDTRNGFSYVRGKSRGIISPDLQWQRERQHKRGD